MYHFVSITACTQCHWIHIYISVGFPIENIGFRILMHPSLNLKWNVTLRQRGQDVLINGKLSIESVVVDEPLQGFQHFLTSHMESCLQPIFWHNSTPDIHHCNH